MNKRGIKPESAIYKEIMESISSISKGPLNFIKTFSSPNMISKNLNFDLIEEEKSEQEKEDSDSNREYTIGNYKVKYTLGQGTFGKVKLGIYVPNSEKVAIKILEKNRIIEKDDEIRVKREFEMLAQFSHPNVILVAEIFESEDSYYSVMEFCEGGELFNYIVKKNRLSEEESAFFFFQLISGLEYIHSLGIVHRDLKPENLLLTGEHILKIIDFGLSNYFKTGQTNLLSTPCGSPCYASPEMVAGKKYDGCKIDVWACGIILYAMLCGYLPFEDPDNEVLFKKILECKLEFPSYVNKLSIDLIEKILITDPEKRITIKDIKKHPFYLKGKEIFEEGFGSNKLVQNPIQKNISKNNIKSDEENIKENVKENIKDNERDNEKEKENINNNDKIIEININDKENKAKIEKNNLQNEEADIGIKKDKEKEKDKNNNIQNKKNENINKDDKKKLKEERRNEANNNIRDNIEKENSNNNTNKKLDDKEKLKKRSKKKAKQNKEKKDNKENKENIVYNDINNKLDKIDGLMKDKIINKMEKDKNKLNIKIVLDNNLNKDNEGIKNNDDNKNIIHSEQEELYMPLRTEYYSYNPFSTLENVKENKINKKEKNQKSNDILKENTLKKYFELKPKEKSVESIRPIPKDKSAPRSKDKKYKLEIQNILDKIGNSTLNKPEEKSKKKKNFTPKKIFYIPKNVKSQRPSNIQNISKKINLKINNKKYLQQKNGQEKLVSAKEPKKIKSTFGNNKNLNININKYANYTRTQIKGILNTFNSNKKSIDENKDNNWQYLKTETINIKKKNNANKNNFINNTIDTYKNNLVFNISDVKNSVNKNRTKKYELNTKLNNDLIDKKKLNDIKRIKSTTFNEEHIHYNSNTFPIRTHTQFGKKQQMNKNQPNNVVYGINNFSNLKVPYELKINDNNIRNNLTINNNSTIKTEHSQDFYLKFSNLPKKEQSASNPHAHLYYLKKNKTNTISIGNSNRNVNPRRTNFQNRPSYIKYSSNINSIRKAPTYNILKTMNLKNLPMTTTDVLKNDKLLSRDKKNNYIISNNKKNQQVTIRNTVINFNMIDTGIILPSVKKIKNDKKFNSTYNTNTAIRMRQNKKYSREAPNEMKSFNTLNSIDNFSSLHSLHNENKYNNTVNRFSNLNNYTKKENKFITNINDYSNTTKKTNSISSFHKLVNKMKNEQKNNKIHLNNINNINNMNIFNDKIHSKFKSMKLVNDYFKTNKLNKKNLEISGINNIKNNIGNNSVNQTIINTSNRIRTLNNDTNFTLPSLINKNKKFVIPKGKGYFIQQGKIGKAITSYKSPNNINENKI